MANAEHTTEADISKQIWNVPNQLSSVRLIMSMLVFVLIPLHFYTAALVLFVIAASTDWIDGWYARKFNQVTQLGRILDPFCDKIIICGTYTLLAVEMKDFPWYAQIAGWMAVIVLGREMLVTALRSFIEQSGGDFSAKMAGKLKMVFQCVAVAAGLVVLIYQQKGGNAPMEGVPTWITVVLISSIWLALITTVHSGIGYVFAAARFLRSSVQ